MDLSFFGIQVRVQHSFEFELPAFRVRVKTGQRQRRWRVI
jgi:hypothetical protein